MVELHHLAKFRTNRSNRGRYMAIFQFFYKMAAVSHPGFVMSTFGPSTKSIWWYLSLYKISL